MEALENKSRLLIYDTRKGKIVEAKNIHEYIQTFKHTFGADKMGDALKILASNFMQNKQFTDAMHIYESLLDNGEPQFVYAMLAHIEYQKHQFENSKKLLSKIDISIAPNEVLAVVTQLYLNLEEAGLALNYAQKYADKIALDKQDYLLLAQVYEFNYSQNPYNRTFLNRAVEHYDQYFYKNLSNRKELYIYEQKDNYLPHAIVYMLLNQNERVAIELIDLFFDWFTIPSRRQLTETINQKIKLVNTPAMDALEGAKKYNQYNDLYHEMKNSIVKVYSNLVPLLFELKAVASAQLQEWDEAKVSLKRAKDYMKTTDNYEKMHATVEDKGAVTVDLLQSYRHSIHNTFVPLVTLHDRDEFLALELELQRILKRIKDLSDLQPEEKLDSMYELASFYLGNAFGNKLKDEDEINQIIVASLNEAHGRLQAQNVVYYEPDNQLKAIEDIEKFLWKDRCEFLLKGKVNKYVSLQLQKISHILDLWVSTEQYYDYLKNVMPENTKTASLLIVGYFKIVEVWLVKLYGEISTGTILSKSDVDNTKQHHNKNNQNYNSYRVGEDIYYYISSTLGNYYNFPKNYSNFNANKPELHPFKADRIERLDNFVESMKEFGRERNIVAHKGEISITEAEQLRKKFYEVMVIAMDALRAPIEPTQ